MKYVSETMAVTMILLGVTACKFDIDDISGYDECATQNCEASDEAADDEEVAAEAQYAEEEEPEEVITVSLGGTDITPQHLIQDNNLNLIGDSIGTHRSFSIMKILLSESKLYTMVRMATGEQTGMPFLPEDNMYFTARDCTGDAAMIHWYGIVGETKIYSKNGRYYQTLNTALYSEGNPFVARSKITFESGECEETDTEIRTRAVNLGEINAPIDLEMLAPLSVNMD